MIIGACGYGATGSSAVTDLLREYEDVQVYDSFEFVLAYRVDGLQDLEYHLMKQYAKNETGDYAIKRFLDATRCYMTPFINKPCKGKEYQDISKEFVGEIEQLSYRGLETVDMLSGNVIRNIFAFFSKKIFMPMIVERITGHMSFLWPCRTIHYSIEPANFYAAAKRYTTRIIQAMGANLTRPVVLDQPFEGNAPEQSFPFFEDPYAVVVDRDPRDLYLEYKMNFTPDGKFCPRTTVEDFIIYYKNMRRKINRSNERVLRITLEELIYEYDITVKKIENFLSLTAHKTPKTYFDPTRSINNEASGIIVEAK